MSNYAQNSNNYFENMLGETANIRSNKIPYFQILILFEKMPYYKNDGEIHKWEEITEHNIDKYIQLSNDNADLFFHSPNKTLIYLVKLSKYPVALDDETIYNFDTFKDYYKNKKISLSENTKNIRFSAGIILNDFEEFINKASHYILSI